MTFFWICFSDRPFYRHAICPTYTFSDMQIFRHALLPTSFSDNLFSDELIFQLQTFRKISISNSSFMTKLRCAPSWSNTEVQGACCILRLCALNVLADLSTFLLVQSWLSFLKLIRIHRSRYTFVLFEIHSMPSTGQDNVCPQLTETDCASLLAHC